MQYKYTVQHNGGFWVVIGPDGKMACPEFYKTVGWAIKKATKLNAEAERENPSR